MIDARCGEAMSASTTLLPFHGAGSGLDDATSHTDPTTGQLAAVSFLARYSGRTHALHASQLKRWCSWLRD